MIEAMGILSTIIVLYTLIADVRYVRRVRKIEKTIYEKRL